MMYGHLSGGFGDSEGSDFECHTSRTSGSLVCSGLTDGEDDAFFTLQHNINRAAKAAGLSEKITEDGIIGPLTVGLAQRVLATSFAQGKVGAVQDAGAIVDARSMASSSGSFAGMFDQIAGDVQVSTSSSSEARSSREAEAVTKPIPPATAARQDAGADNTALIIGIVAGVAIVGIVGVVAYQRRRARVQYIRPSKHKALHRRFFKRSGGEEVIIRPGRGRHVSVRA